MINYFIFIDNYPTLSQKHQESQSGVIRPNLIDKPLDFIYLIINRVAEYISGQLGIPTIGIGAGGGCDGQVLVTHDLLGLFDKFTPKFVKQYKSLHQEISAALASFKTEVEDRTFPGSEHEFMISDQEWERFLEQMGRAEK